MHYTILLSLLAVALAAPRPQQGYTLNSPAPGGEFKSEPVSSGSSCGESEAIGPDGNCIMAEVSRNIFVFQAPQLAGRNINRPEIPKQKLNYNIVFVKTPDAPEDVDPVIAPPPQQKTIVYVLHKAPEDEEVQLIEMPNVPHAPEVFYINYREGENPQLPIGIDLQSALAAAMTEQGQEIISGLGGGSSGGFDFGGRQSGGSGGIVAGGGGGGGGFVAGGSAGGFAAGGSGGGFAAGGSGGGFAAGGSGGGFAAGGSGGGFAAGGSGGGFVTGGSGGGFAGGNGGPSSPSGLYNTPQIG